MFRKIHLPRAGLYSLVATVGFTNAAVLGAPSCVAIDPASTPGTSPRQPIYQPQANVGLLPEEMAATPTNTEAPGPTPELPPIWRSILSDEGVSTPPVPLYRIAPESAEREALPVPIPAYGAAGLVALGGGLSYLGARWLRLVRR